MKPKKTYRPKKSTTDSFRIKIGGSGNIWTMAELRAMLMEAVDRIEAAGITHVKPFSVAVMLREIGLRVCLLLAFSTTYRVTLPWGVTCPTRHPDMAAFEVITEESATTVQFAIGRHPPEESVTNRRVVR
jgi:hypothetical protein